MPQIRRQVYLLSSQDLDEYPLWEFCSDEENAEGQDEATVRPCRQVNVSNDPGVYVLAVDAIYIDGGKATGYMYSGRPNEFGTIQPNILTSTGSVGFWLGMLQFVDKDAIKTAAYSKMDKLPQDVFPIRFQTRVPLDGVHLTVRVDGFMGLDDVQGVSTFR